jgi:hypothetical protein
MNSYGVRKDLFDEIEFKKIMILYISLGKEKTFKDK